MKKYCFCAAIVLFSASSLADVVIDRGKVICTTERGIRKVAAMKEFKKVRQLPDSCRTLDAKRKGNVVRFSGKKYVKFKPNTGVSFYTLTRWTR